MATITSLGFSIFSTYHGRGVGAARRDLRRLGATINSVDRMNGALSPAPLRSIGAAAAAASPLLVGMGAAAAKAGATFITMGVQAGTALGIYGGVMAAAANRALELAAAHKHLNSNQKSFVSSINNLRNAWNRFLDGVGSKTLQPLTIGMQALARNIHKLGPVINAVHPVVMKVARAFADWLDRENGLKRFLGIIQNQGVAALDHLFDAARHVLGFLGIAFRTLAPDGVKMAAAIERGARALHNWGKSGGFARFVSSVKANGPEVRAFFSALGGASVQLLKALNGLFPVYLRLATAMLRVIEAMPIPVLQALIIAYTITRSRIAMLIVSYTILGARFLLLNRTMIAHRIIVLAQAAGYLAAAAAIRVYTFVTRVATVATRLLALAFRLTPAGLIITAVLAIAAAIAFLATRTRFFQAAWRVIWRVMVVVARASWVVLGPIFRGIAAGWRVMGRVMGVVWRAVIRPVFMMFARLARFLWRAALRPVFNLIKAGWRLLGGVFRVVWRVVIRPVFTLFARVARFLWRAALRPVFNLIKAGWRLLGRVFRVVWRTVIRPVFTLFGRIARFLWRNALRTVFNLIKAGWRLLGRVIRVVWRSVIRPVFTLMGRAARFMWRNALRPVWNLIKAAWRLLGRVIRTVWRAVISNAWGAMNRAARFMWRNVLRPVWNLIKAGWRLLGRVLRSVWRSTISNVWGAMNAAARFMWRSVLRPTWNAIKAAWRLLGRVLRAVWRSGISNTFGAMNAAIRFMWNRVARPIWNAIKAGWRLLGRVLRAVWRTGISNTFGAMNAAIRFMWRRVARPTWAAVRNAWSALGRGLRGVWRQVINPMFDALRGGLRNVKRAFDVAIGGIRKAWSKLKGIVSGPVRFFVNTVYNGGLRKAWNNTVGKIPGVTNLPSFTVNFARGGYVSGPGGPTADKIPARLSDGEFVMRAKAVRQIGVDNLNRMNRAGGRSGCEGGDCARRSHRRPRRGFNSDMRRRGHRNQRRGGGLHLAGGGLVPGFALGGKVDIGEIVKGATGAILKIAKTSDFLSGGGGFFGQLVDNLVPGTDDASGGFDWATSFFQDIARKAARGLLNPFVNLTERISHGLFPGAGGPDDFGGVMPKLLKSAIDAMVDHIWENANQGFMSNGFVPFRPWRAGDGRKVNFRGHTLNVRTRAMIRHAEKMIKKRFQIFQGSYSTGVGASAGTHAGGGAADLGPTGNPRVAALRASGFAAWNRGPGWGSSMFSKHIHAIAAGDPTVSGPGKAQLKQFFNGGDGLGGKDNFPPIASGIPGGKGVKRWAALARVALRMGGCPAGDGNVRELLDLMRQESGGNPRAQNNWDSNAAAGQASRGLMQVIPSTFKANHCKGTSSNIFDPLANMCASVKYIKRKYGCRIPNAPYAGGGLVQALNGGGMVKTFDQGGWLGPGLNLVNNATGHNEPVGNQMRDEVNVNIHGSVYTKSDREFREMIIREVASARRRGRI